VGEHPLRRRQLADDGAALAVEEQVRSPQRDGNGVVDRCLAEIGRTRRVVLRIRYVLAAPLVVARSDLIVTAPRALAAGLLGVTRLRMLPPPLELPRFTTHMVWHERAETDPAHRWLRDAVVATCGRR
jgi:DNA-binding transcriptional LysR family regulator